MRFRMAAAVLGIAALGAIAAPSSAFAFRDTPAFLMAKGLNNSSISGTERGWHLHCSRRWHPAGGEAWWGSRCWRIHKREGRGHRSNFYDGHGLVLLRLRYGVFYWSYEFDIRLFRRGCKPRVEPWQQAEYEDGYKEWEKAHEEWVKSNEATHKRWVESNEADHKRWEEEYERWVEFTEIDPSWWEEHGLKVPPPSEAPQEPQPSPEPKPQEEPQPPEAPKPTPCAHERMKRAEAPWQPIILH